MILEEETFKKYGYYPSKLKSKSGERIIVKCDECGEVRESYKCSYSKLCKSCAHKGEKNSFFGKHHSKESKERISKNHADVKGKNNPRFGKHCSEKTKMILSTNAIKRLENPKNHPMYGKHHTEETKQKISKSEAEKTISMETKEKMSEAQLKRFETFNSPMLGKYHSEETRKKMRLNHADEKGNSNPNWKGGLSFEPYCIKFNNDLKERVREFFDRKCYLCGKNEFENSRKLAVRHVNYDKMVCCNDIEPLFIPLCMDCHCKTNFGREEWQEFFEVSLSYLTNNKCFYRKGEMEKL